MFWILFLFYFTLFSRICKQTARHIQRKRKKTSEKYLQDSYIIHTFSMNIISIAFSNESMPLSTTHCSSWKPEEIVWNMPELLFVCVINRKNGNFLPGDIDKFHSVDYQAKKNNNWKKRKTFLPFWMHENSICSLTPSWIQIRFCVSMKITHAQWIELQANGTCGILI